MILKTEAFKSLQIPEFRNFISGRFFITLAYMVQAVTVGWQVYELTKDPLSLGLIGLAEAVPSIITALFSGHIVDISDRKKILLSSYSLLFLCSILLFFISTNVVDLTNMQRVIYIYSVIFISGIARGFVMPSSFAFMAQLVPRVIYSNAVTWNINIWQIGAVLGPAIGGLIYGFYGVSISYLTVVILIGGAIFAMSFISKKPIPELSDHYNLSDRLTAGIKFVFKNKIILGAITLDLFAVLFGGTVAMLPVFASDILFTGPQGLGILRAAPAVGAVLMSLYLAHRPPTLNAGRNLIVSVAGFGLSIIVFAISKSFLMSLIALAFSGMFDSVSVIIRHTIIQLNTPENMKGRVSAVNSIFIGSSNEIGAFESGLAAKLMGVVPSVIFGGVMTLVVVTAVTLLSPPIRKLKL